MVPPTQRLMVPTQWVNAMLAVPCNFDGTPHNPGEMVRLPYGSAIQLLAVGAVRTIENAENEHISAMENLAVYGPDSWFAPHMQTIGKIREVLETGQPQRTNAPSTEALQ